MDNKERKYNVNLTTWKVWNFSIVVSVSLILKVLAQNKHSICNCAWNFKTLMASDIDPSRLKESNILNSAIHSIPQQSSHGFMTFQALHITKLCTTRFQDFSNLHLNWRTKSHQYNRKYPTIQKTTACHDKDSMESTHINQGL